MAADFIPFDRRLAERFDTWSLYTTASWMGAFIDPDRLQTSMVASAGPNPEAVLVTHEMPDGWKNTVYDSFSLAGGSLGGDRQSWLPQLLLGARVGQRNALSLRSDLSGQDRLEALKQVLHALDRWDGTIGYLYLDAADADDVIVASDHQYLPLLTEAGSVLSVPAGSFDDWVASLKSSHRSVVRRDIAAFEGDLVTRVLEEGDARIPVYAELLANVQQHHDQPSSAAAMEGYLVRCISAGFPVVAFEANNRDGLSGVGIGIEHGDTLWMRVVGLRYDERNGTNGAYPQVLIYSPLRYAIERSLRVIDLGAGVSKAKHLRGATKIPLWSVFRPPVSTMPVDANLLRAINLARADELGVQADPYPGSLVMAGP